MKSFASEFKLFKRGFKETLVLIPGWATDYRIFNTLELDYDYLLAVKFSPFNFREGLAKFLNKEKIDRISIFGYSMGGFLGCEFASAHPEKIKELILIGIRKKYDLKTIGAVKLFLKKNKEAYLYSFYGECFSSDDKEGYLWFRKNLLKDYLWDMQLQDLLYGLDYLSQAQISPGSLSALENIRIFHGGQDRIALIEEASRIKSELPQAKFTCLKGLGHLPFLNRKFKDEFDNG